MLSQWLRLVLATCLLTTAVSRDTHLLAQGLPSFVSALAVDPSDSETIYAGTPTGIYKTTDAGATWARFDSELRYTYVGALAIDPTAPCTVYGGLDSRLPVMISPGFPPIVMIPFTNALLAISRDCGATWGYPPQQPVGQAIRGLALAGGPDPALFGSMSRYQRLPALPWVDSVGDIIRVTESGTDTTPEFPGRLFPFGHTVAADPSAPCVGYVGGSSGKVWKSAGCGALTWSEVGSPMMAGAAPHSITALAIHPTNSETILAGSGTGILFRKDSSLTDWTPIADFAQSIGSLVYAPGSDRVVYATSGGGAYKSLDGGTTWARAATFNGSVTLVAGGARPVFRMYAVVNEPTRASVVQFECGPHDAPAAAATPARRDGTIAETT